jgi:hypothetical protein
MSQTSRISKNNTSIEVRSEKTIVRLHNTAIVTLFPKAVELNSGGWRTATTRTRMNQVSNEWHLGYCVFQRKGEWFVSYRVGGRIENPLKFFDGIAVPRADK